MTNSQDAPEIVEGSDEVSGNDIAIVGMSGRFPGAGSVDELWDTVVAGRSGMTRFTDAELRAAGVAEHLLRDPNYVKSGGVIDGIDRFDAGFFGVGNAEAQILDPQQRLFLEHSWHALEDAGYDPGRYDGSIGVFGGAAWSSYVQNNLMPGNVGARMGELAVGLANDKDSLATRVAHSIGLTGPAYSVQSYCSTSLVAVCAAATSLANYECDAALAGGVAVGVPHRVGYLYQTGGISPPDGECRAFDAAGLGAPLGSGVGVVVLTRLEDALANGDRIYAVIRGWAVNNDGGRKVGFTAPGVQGQIAVVAEAMSSAGVTADDIDYVEAHGTGTALGDASEIAALQAVFDGSGTMVGSIKTNVGHLDRAAGVTGLIKTALSLTHEQIPPTRNLTTPNPQLAAASAELDIVTELTPWPRESGRRRRAGVSAFGIGGTNAHVVLEEAPARPSHRADERPQLLVWSARAAAAADDATAQLAEWFETATDVDTSVADVAHTLQRGRRPFAHRRAIVATSVLDAAAKLAGGDVLMSGRGVAERPVAFLISGTGEQYPGLVRDLYASEPVFRDALEYCRAALVRHLDGIDPLAELLGPRVASGDELGGLLGRGTNATELDTLRLQPATFAVGWAVAQLLASWGVRPSIVAGYSIGEYVAACLAGVLSLDDALALVAHRATLVDALPAGSMAAVPLSADALTPYLAEWDVDVAAVSGHELTVISGAVDAMAAACSALAADGVVTRALATTHAFHSRMLEPAHGPLIEWITEHVTLRAPQVPTVSNVTGALLTAQQATDPAYWAEQMCAPVRFDAVLATVLDAGEHAVIEIGPGRSLGAMVCGHADCPPERWATVTSTLPAASDPRTADDVLADSLARLWLAGVDVDWAGYRGGRHAATVGLPGYPFQRESYWIDPPELAAAAPVEESDHVRLMTPAWSTAPATTGDRPARVVLVGGPADLVAGLTAALPGVEVTADQDGEVRPGAAATTVLDLRLLDAAHDPEDAVLPVADLVDRWSAAPAATTVLIATRGGQVVTGGERPDPVQAAAGVLPAVAIHEYVGLAVRAVDLDPAGIAGDVTALLAELDSAADDVLTAHRDGARHVRGFTAHDADDSPAATVTEGAAYLVTGGLGDVGQVVAEHLARAGAGRLVLTSRHARPDHPAVARLRALGAEVTVAAVDITDARAVRALLTGLRTDGIALDGVVHAAAQTSPDTFRPLRNLDPEVVELHFGAKVAGAEVLAETLADSGHTPRFCIVFSSTSSLLGGLAFGSYAAANAALSAVAATHDDPAGTRWVAAAWDTWAMTLQKLDDGAGVGATMAQHAMSADEGLTAFDRLLSVAAPAVVVAAGGLTDRLPRLVAAAAPPAELPAGQRFTRPELPQPYAAPLTGTERDLAEVWSGVLGVEPVGTRDNFFDLGGNSLLALQMLSLVKTRLGAAVASVDLFEAPTVQALAALVDTQRGGATTLERVEAASRPRTGDGTDRRIAVIGMAGRFPGAGDVATFWRNICDGVESISFFSREELVAAGVDEATIDDPSYVPARPVLDDVQGFDAGFFGMSPRMAALTDPQQRLFLEVCWEGLEQSGYANPDGRARVGVYGGTNLSTYLLQMPPESLSGGDVSTYEIIMGNEKDALTTTASYLFDLHGPSVAVQTFCSTSLVATHLAVQALRAGDCELAIAGGVSVRVPQKVGHVFGPGGMESPDGHVRTFDAQARGSMFGDGAAVVVLKPLEAALRDGDHVWSVIRGTAMNNDGALKVGYTAPSVVGQAQVVVEALADAEVTGDDIAYVEAHGTATELGDPIEVAALTRAFGPTERTGYCPIGSVKTNIGHLDRAAGVTGLIKTSMALHEGVIPPTLHYTSPNPEIDFDNSPFYVDTTLAPWAPREGQVPMAGISSLGMGGTNAHVVVEQAAPRTSGPGADADDATARRYHVVPVSARTKTAVEQWCTGLATHLDEHPDVRLADLAYTLQVGRKTFEHRRAAIADSTSSAATALAGAMLQRVDSAQGRGVAYLFTGVGEQYPGLVAELYRREPAFAAALDECLALVPDGTFGDLDVRDLLTGGRTTHDTLAAMLGRAVADDPRGDALARTEIVQPALFAVEYALATTLRGWGLPPRIMLGYSLGEYVAACLAGVLSLADAVALVAHRATLIGTVEAGRMLAVGLADDELRRRFDLADLDIAAVTGPQTCVVAGRGAAVDALAAALAAAEVPSRPLQTTGAFHSRMLEPLREQLTDWVRANVTLRAPQLPYVSNVTGAIADADLVTDPGYWAQHMCETVRFADGVRTLLAEPGNAIAEIGPGQSLSALVRGSGVPADEQPVLVALLPAASDPRPDDAVLTEGLARLWLAGVGIDWAAVHGRTADASGEQADGLPGRIPLPTYPFQRQPYWIEGRPMIGGGGTAAGRIPELEGEISLETIAQFPKLPEDEWLFLPTWRQTATPSPAGTTAREWLVYACDGIADDILTGLRDAAADATITLVRPGTAFASTDAGYTVRPGNLEDTVALLRALRTDGRTLDRVVHLWSLGTAPEEAELPRGLHALVALARAAGELGHTDWRLDVVAAGTQEVLPGDVGNPMAATLTGPCRVIPLEYPGVVARLVDLDVTPGRRAVRSVVAELLSDSDAPLVAVRHGRRWLQDHEKIAPPADSAPVFRHGGVYLVTGGLGGIALSIAQRLVRDHDARLVLLSRRPRPSADEWPEGIPDDAEIVTGDVSDPDDVRRAIEVAQQRFGALHGVLHAAGLPAQGLMQFKKPEELAPVLAPKVDGALALAEALRLGKPDAVELDQLVLFSSITSGTGGGPGQVDYCAANAFLDSYAYALRAADVPVVSINWGEWTWNAWESGLEGYDPKLQEFFRSNRVRIGIDFEQGWRALNRALALDEPRAVVCSQDFPTMVRYSSKFTVAVVSSDDARGDATRHPRPELVTAYQEPSSPEEQTVAAVWCEALRLERVGIDDNYFELGGNSLLGVSIVAALRREFPDADLPPHVLYETPTVATLVASLLAPPAPTAPAGEPTGNSVRAQLRRSGVQASADRRRHR